MDLIRTIEESQKKAEVPSFRVGDTVKVHLRIVEGEKERRTHAEPFGAQGRSLHSRRRNNGKHNKVEK